MNSNGLHLLFLIILNQLISCIALKCYSCDPSQQKRAARASKFCGPDTPKKETNCEDGKVCVSATVEVIPNVSSEKVLRCDEKNYCERFKPGNQPEPSGAVPAPGVPPATKPVEVVPEATKPLSKRDLSPLKVLDCRTCETDLCNHSQRKKISLLALPLTVLLHICKLKFDRNF